PVARAAQQAGAATDGNGAIEALDHVDADERPAHCGLGPGVRLVEVDLVGWLWQQSAHGCRCLANRRLLGLCLPAVSRLDWLVLVRRKDIHVAGVPHGAV